MVRSVVAWKQPTCNSILTSLPVNVNVTSLPETESANDQQTHNSYKEASVRDAPNGFLHNHESHITLEHLLKLVTLEEKRLMDKKKCVYSGVMFSLKQFLLLRLI